MNTTIENLLNERVNNHILPFFWLHGEEESVLREYMEAIHESGIGAVCVESRPHPDYCGPKWWIDMDIILDEARKRNMKVWILDDSHFPTGYANGSLKNAPAADCQQFLYFSSVEVNGPTSSVQLNLEQHSKFTKDPLKVNFFSMMHPGDQVQYDDDRILNISATRVDQGFDEKTTLDLTAFVQNGELTWDVPNGRWNIMVTFVTRNAGSRQHYINMLTDTSTSYLINAVYEPHFQHYHADFGTTIAGFFSDEPEYGNGAMYDTQSPIGSNMDLPWSDTLEKELKERLGENWLLKLPLLWNQSISDVASSTVRYMYMDCITRITEKVFSQKIGQWCEAHHVEYIGHLIEDNNAHSRLGPSLGHFFRGMSGQHMAGIDDIGAQVIPGGEIYPKRQMFGNRDGEFYHYLLGKLGSSLGAIDPIKHGRTMCEIFGAYGWSLGVKDMKYLVDHFLVRGINTFVPHAFSAKPYPDPDCPPHFYAHGHNPQYRHFGALMHYLNRMCNLISDGKSVTPVAMLYHAEGEWCGETMFNQTIAHVLMDHQIDFDIVPADVFTDHTKYHTNYHPQLTINQKPYQVLVIPAMSHITGALAEQLIQLADIGNKILFIDRHPDFIVDGDASLIDKVKKLPLIPLDELVSHADDAGLKDIHIEPNFNKLRCLHYKREKSIYLFTNENIGEAFTGTVDVRNKGVCYGYDAWKNTIYPVNYDQSGESTQLHLTIEPYQSYVIVFDDTLPDFSSEQLQWIPAIEELSTWENLGFESSWTQRLAKSIDYPSFGAPSVISTFKSVALTEPAFSGFIRYENRFEIPQNKKATSAILTIEDAFEGVEVFIDDTSLGIQIVKPFVYYLPDTLPSGKHTITIEVATTLERERHFAPADPADFAARLGKTPVLRPTGIIGDVCLYYKE